MKIGGRDVYPGCPCVHSTASGCDDYANRPEDPCRRFVCGWVMDNSPLPDWMRPDQCGAIVLFNKFAWRGVPVDLAVPVGESIPARTLEWLKAFARQHGRPLLYAEQVKEAGVLQKQQQIYAHGPPEFQADIGARLRAGEKLW
jgi:hypothetical protein